MGPASPVSSPEPGSTLSRWTARTARPGGKAASPIPSTPSRRPGRHSRAVPMEWPSPGTVLSRPSGALGDGDEGSDRETLEAALELIGGTEGELAYLAERLDACPTSRTLRHDEDLASDALARCRHCSHQSVSLLAGAPRGRSRSGDLRPRRHDHPAASRDRARAARRLWRRHRHRCRVARRRRRQPRTAPFRGSLGPPVRGLATRGLLGQSHSPPTQPRRGPPGQPGAVAHRDHPARFGSEDQERAIRMLKRYVAREVNPYLPRA
jgi:hypothetical protein